MVRKKVCLREGENYKLSVSRKTHISIVLCVIVFCCMSLLRTHFFCNSAEQPALHGGGVPFHLVLAKTPTLNNCSHSEVGRGVLMGSVRKCVCAFIRESACVDGRVCLCVCDEGTLLT